MAPIEQITLNNVEQTKVETPALEKSAFSGSLFDQGNFPTLGGGLQIPNLFNAPLLSAEQPQP